MALLTKQQIESQRLGLLHVNDIIPVPLDQSYPGICKDIFNRIGTKEITFNRTFKCFLWELRPCQQNIYGYKVQWILKHLQELPPIVVMDYQKRLFIIDGHHRVCAATLLGLKEIDCHVVKVDFTTTNFR